MKRPSITDAKNGLSALIDRVRHGESVIIEDRGVPAARLLNTVPPSPTGGVTPTDAVIAERREGR